MFEAKHCDVHSELPLRQRFNLPNIKTQRGRMSPIGYLMNRSIIECIKNLYWWVKWFTWTVKTAFNSSPCASENFKKAFHFLSSFTGCYFNSSLLLSVVPGRVFQFTAQQTFCAVFFFLIMTLDKGEGVSRAVWLPLAPTVAELHCVALTERCFSVSQCSWLRGALSELWGSPFFTPSVHLDSDYLLCLETSRLSRRLISAIEPTSCSCLKAL